MGFFKAAVAVVLVMAAFFLGRLSAPLAAVIEEEDFAQADPDEVEIYELRNSSSYISPLLACEGDPASFQAIREGSQVVNDIIEAAKTRGDIQEASVYFRDLNNGPSFDANEDALFVPASLLKLPLLIAYLAVADADPGILDKTVMYNGSPFPISQNFMDEPPLEAGVYSVRELLDRMIRDSDNVAMNLLIETEDFISLEQIEEIYRDLGILSPIDVTDYRITVRTYAFFLRILYNSTYLSREMSDYALRMLADTNFDEGLMAGLPAGVVAAHKFGERANPGTGARELHDCGVIYAAGRPYLLCVMTRGNDFARLSSVIAEISRAVYERVTQ